MNRAVDALFAYLVSLLGFISVAVFFGLLIGITIKVAKWVAL